MTSGRVSFVGAGPGAADLITLRGAKRIADADIVVWAASLVDPGCVRDHARPDAELVDSSRITHDDVLAIYRRTANENLRVARVHSGDPSLWGAVQEQYDSCQRLGIEVEIVPGVSAFSAAAAIVGRELTVPEVAQSVILTRLEGGKTPMPDGEHIREFARHGTTMAIFLSAARSGQLVDELRAGGYSDDTPVVVAYKVTWADELVLHTTVGELAETVKQHKLWRHTLFLVGKALRASGTRSHLYNAGHFHTYRKADPAARRALRAAGAGTEQATEPSPAGSADAESGTRARTGWPLHTSRTGWVAARVAVANTWPVPRAQPTDEQPPTGDRLSTGDRPLSGERRAAGGRRPAVEGERLAGASQPASVAAWSAVRGWQETARSAPRGGSRPRVTGEHPRPIRVLPADQATLALDAESDIAPTPAESATPPAESVLLAESVAPVESVPPVETAQVDAAQVETAPPEQSPKPVSLGRPTGKRANPRRSGKNPADRGQQSSRPGPAPAGGGTPAPE